MHGVLVGSNTHRFYVSAHIPAHVRPHTLPPPTPCLYPPTPCLPPHTLPPSPHTLPPSPRNLPASPHTLPPFPNTTTPAHDAPHTREPSLRLATQMLLRKIPGGCERAGGEGTFDPEPWTLDPGP